VPPRRDDKTRCEALYVPLERSWKGFVEIVDIENEVSFRRGETAKIHQVTVAANVDLQRGLALVSRQYRENRRTQTEAFVNA